MINPGVMHSLDRVRDQLDALETDDIQTYRVLESLYQALETLAVAGSGFTVLSAQDLMETAKNRRGGLSGQDVTEKDPSTGKAEVNKLGKGHTYL